MRSHAAPLTIIAAISARVKSSALERAVELIEHMPFESLDRRAQQLHSAGGCWSSSVVRRQAGARQLDMIGSRASPRSRTDLRPGTVGIRQVASDTDIVIPPVERPQLRSAHFVDTDLDQLMQRRLCFREFRRRTNARLWHSTQSSRTLASSPGWT